MAATVMVVAGTAEIGIVVKAQHRRHRRRRHYRNARAAAAGAEHPDPPCMRPRQSCLASGRWPRWTSWLGRLGSSGSVAGISQSNVRGGWCGNC